MVTDNQVSFVGYKGLHIKSGKFKVADHCVPASRRTTLCNGRETTFWQTQVHDDGFTKRYFNSGLRFAVDLMLSSQVANWWKARIRSAETTFGVHDPRELYFALRGTLTLETKSDGTFVFEDVFLAKGHSAFTDNWWFAAPGAKANGGVFRDAIKVKARDGRVVTFLRGSGVPASEVWVQYDRRR